MKLRRGIARLIDHPVDLIVKHFENRLFELAMAVIFLGSSIQLILSPGSFHSGGLIYLSATFNLWTLITIFFIVGVSRIIALGLNGHWVPYGSWVRAAGAAVGAVMWFQVDAALVVFATNGNPLPFSTVTYGALALFEAVSMYRALLGARRQDGKGTVDLGDRRSPIIAVISRAEFDRIYNSRRGDWAVARESPQVAQG